MKFVDLSVPIVSRPIEGLSEDLQKAFSQKLKVCSPEIEYIDHQGGAEAMKRSFDCSDEDFPIKGLGWATEEIVLSSHAGTHMDAPYHYGPISEGRPALTVDQIPLEWCYGDGVVLDFGAKEPRSKIEVCDLEAELTRIGYQIKPLDIVFIRTGWDKFYGTVQYLRDYPGMTRQSTLWLIEKGVKTIGIDSPGFDRPFDVMAEEFHRTGNAKVIWEAHFAGLVRGYCHIEKMANLNLLPPFGFKVCCFPIPLERASAGWVRPVAILE